MSAVPLLRPADPQRVEALELAFAQFNETSRQLQSSWSALQERVDELTRERDAAQRARLAELAERERVADRLQALLGALPGAALMIDGDGRVRECNAGANELLGQSLLGQPWRDVAAHALHARSDSDGTPCLSDGRRLGVSRRATADGGCVLLLTDESEAHARRSGIERQRQISDVDQQRARLAHQLRTPLSTAVLYLSRIADGGLDAQAAQRMAGKALMRLVDLQRLIDQTLALARGDADTNETLDVSGLLRDAIGNIAAGATCGIDIDDTCSGACVHGQRNLLVSTLVNLLDNALAFSPRVFLQAARHDGGVTLAVHDDGPGVDAATAERIFEPFFTTRAGGTGLGLAMARSVARAHGGELLLAPSPRGARFELRLPLAGDARILPSDLHVLHSRSGTDPQHQGTLS
ncbi:MAG TPA: PAS domain-containing sensor histidine kinase [Rhodanobacteraceae bacterium]|nr:PAS domain-containing sensor histidine kinase [Rhodanobacteraceae bacterium]